MISVAAILQARMTSTRLPGKALCPLAGVPLVEHIINRLKAVAELDHIILAVQHNRKARESNRDVFLFKNKYFHMLNFQARIWCIVKSMQ